MLQKYFNRFEIKYQIALRERDNILRYMTPFMSLDSHVKNHYNYEVRSVYFDSPFRNSFYEKINGIKVRRKLRLRYYPDFQKDDNELIFIEIKSKNNENVSKRRISVPFLDAFELLDNESKIAKNFYKNASEQDKKTLLEIWYLRKRYKLQPVCVVCYKRQPYVSKLEKTFRITFDTNIQSRNFNFDLRVGGGSKFVLPRSFCVMEIKFTSFIPNWAVKIVHKSNSIQEKISKFAQGLKKAKSFSVI